MTEQLIPIGILIIFIGVAILVIGAILTTLKSKGKVEWAFGGFVGPIPFGWATKEELLKLIIIISVIFLIIFLLINRRIIGI